MHILEMYFVIYSMYLYLYIYIYNIRYIYTIFIYIYTLCIAYISSHSKGPEQDQLRSPFAPYVRNTAEHSIHIFDSQPYIYICKYMIIYCLHVRYDAKIQYSD